VTRSVPPGRAPRPRASWDEARRAAHAAAVALPAETVPLSDALGRTLAEPLWALAALPAFDTAAMDGWAVRGPGPWRVRGRTLAGDPPPPPLEDGQAREVATGAAVPAACDGVVPVEQGVLLGDELTAAPPVGRHVRWAGEECAARTAVLAAGTRLRPTALGLAAALGHDALPVRPRPRVVALVTGDELLAAGLPGGGRIRDAVGPLLPGAVAGLDGALVGLHRLGDTRAALVEALGSAAADLVLTSGASSAGPADHLAAALHEVGAEVLLDGVAVRPGGPQTLARLTDGRLLVGLPGNPLAALAALVTVAGPALAGLAGQPLPRLGCARAVEPLPAGAATRLVPVRVRDGLARPTGHGGSAMLRGAATADAFAVVEAPVAEGDRVRLVPLP
jgi:molybdopterin molybdotransferase